MLPIGVCCHCQGVEYCQGACRMMYEGRPCFHCHDPNPEADGASACAFAMDLGNAQCALLPHCQVVGAMARTLWTGAGRM